MSAKNTHETGSVGKTMSSTTAKRTVKYEVGNDEQGWQSCERSTDSGIADCPTRDLAPPVTAKHSGEATRKLSDDIQLVSIWAIPLKSSSIRHHGHETHYSDNTQTVTPSCFFFVSDGG